MTKAELVAMGLTEEQAQKVMDSLDGDFVTKARFNEVNDELKATKKSLSDRDKQLETLKQSATDNAALQQQISDLQKANADAQKAHEAELAQVKLDNAIDLALGAAKAKNAKAVKAMLDMEKVKLSDDGKLTGFDDQLEALRKSDGYMFDAEPQQKQPSFTGFQPGASGAVPDSKAAGYESRLAEARKSGNNLDAIRVKQEAAADGYVLL